MVERLEEKLGVRLWKALSIIRAWEEAGLQRQCGREPLWLLPRMNRIGLEQQSCHRCLNDRQHSLPVGSQHRCLNDRQHGIYTWEAITGVQMTDSVGSICGKPAKCLSDRQHGIYLWVGKGYEKEGFTGPGVLTKCLISSSKETDLLSLKMIIQEAGTYLLRWYLSHFRVPLSLRAPWL